MYSFAAGASAFYCITYSTLRWRLLGPGFSPHAAPAQTSNTSGVPPATGTEIGPESLLYEGSEFWAISSRYTGTKFKGPPLMLITPIVPVGEHPPLKLNPRNPPPSVTRVIRMSLLGTTYPPTWPGATLPGKNPPKYMWGAAFMDLSPFMVRPPDVLRGPPTLTPAPVVIPALVVSPPLIMPPPPTLRLPPMRAPDASIFPATSRVVVGLGLLMPTFPLARIVKRPATIPGASTTTGAFPPNERPSSLPMTPFTCRG